MQPLYHELSVLAKAVHFKNLSTAAMHVGLSQPQLSRIIAKLEDSLQLTLLDRSAKKKSSWTAVAIQVAETFEKANRRLESEIAHLSAKQARMELRIGTLEGLSEIALSLVHSAFDVLQVHKITLNIEDLLDLESQFLSGEFDLILTSKTPGKQKFKYTEKLGTQIMETQQTSRDFGIFSTFEFSHMDKKATDGFKHVLVSNSLAIKRDWMRLFLGTTTIPSEPRRTRASTGIDVLMVGSDLLTPTLWQGLTDLTAGITQDK